MAKTKEHELAYDFYINTAYGVDEIAEKVGVTEKTLRKWIQQQGWDALRAAQSITRNQQIKYALQQINELNEGIAMREKGSRFPSAAEADTLAKLHNNIKALQKDTGLSDFITVFEQFHNWLSRMDGITLDQRKDIIRLQDRFIVELADQLR